MPTYEYSCKNCASHLEVVQSFQDEALTECPSCGGQLRKVFGNIGIAFKGSGFYKTDSRSSSTATSTPSEPSSADGAAKESAPAAKEPAAGTTEKKDAATPTTPKKESSEKAAPAPATSA